MMKKFGVTIILGVMAAIILGCLGVVWAFWPASDTVAPTSGEDISANAVTVAPVVEPETEVAEVDDDRLLEIEIDGHLIKGDMAVQSAEAVLNSQTFSILDILSDHEVFGAHSTYISRSSDPSMAQGRSWASNFEDGVTLPYDVAQSWFNQGTLYGDTEIGKMSYDDIAALRKDKQKTLANMTEDEKKEAYLWLTMEEIANNPQYVDMCWQVYAEIPIVRLKNEKDIEAYFEYRESLFADEAEGEPYGLDRMMTYDSKQYKTMSDIASHRTWTAEAQKWRDKALILFNEFALESISTKKTTSKVWHMMPSDDARTALVEGTTEQKYQVTDDFLVMTFRTMSSDNKEVKAAEFLISPRDKRWAFPATATPAPKPGPTPQPKTTYHALLIEYKLDSIGGALVAPSYNNSSYQKGQAFSVASPTVAGHTIKSMAVITPAGWAVGSNPAKPEGVMPDADLHIVVIYTKDGPGPGPGDGDPGKGDPGKTPTKNPEAGGKNAALQPGATGTAIQNSGTIYEGGGKNPGNLQTTQPSEQKPYQPDLTELTNQVKDQNNGYTDGLPQQTQNINTNEPAQNQVSTDTSTGQTTESKNVQANGDVPLE